MKEIISKRNKKPYFYLLVIALIAIFSSTRYLRVSPLGYIALPMLIACVLLSIISIFLLVDSHGVIERVDDTIIIRRGIRKTTINKNDILDVFPTPHPNKPNEIQKNVISIKVLANGKEKTLICGDVMDVESAVAKLIDLSKEA